MKGDNEEIREAVKLLKDNYNFRGLLHFTDFSNLKSIINIGYLLSRALCYAYDIEFFDISDDDLSARAKDFVRFYFTEKNNEALLRLKTPVYLLFSEDIIILNLSIFLNGNEDDAKTKQGMELSFFINEIDWEAIFNKKHLLEILEGSKKHSLLSKKQSELMLAEPVSLKHLKNIIFRCEADYKRACNLFGKNKIYSVEPDMFYHEDNYIKDYNIYYDSIRHKDLFILHFNSNLPVKNNGNHEYRLYDLNDNLLRTAKISFLESFSTNFNLEVNNLPEQPVKFKLWFYGILCIEEIIG